MGNTARATPQLLERNGLTARALSPDDLARLTRAREDEALTAEDRHAALSALGKEVARLEAGHLVTRMIRDSGMTLGQIQDRYGFDKATLSRMWVLRRILSPMGTIDAMEFLLDKMKDSKTNEDFFETMNQ